MDKKSIRNEVKEAYDRAVANQTEVGMAFDEEIKDSDFAIEAKICVFSLFISLHFPGGRITVYPKDLDRKETIDLFTDFIWRRYFKQ